ncbi:MAG: hypothetical protein M1274_03850, partial [Actinobacteria bacterium]|nr:hypothetical protein [Actinomycetota bacterium]
SIHEGNHYPGTGLASEVGSGDGAGFTINVPLRAGGGDGAILAPSGSGSDLPPGWRGFPRSRSGKLGVTPLLAPVALLFGGSCHSL